jgi:DNA-directed RNA polymerase specialized sigma24 family protein
MEGSDMQGKEYAVRGQSGGAVRQKWTLTQDAFDRLLDSLGPDRDTAGGRYLEIRRNLVRLFEWRGCSTPDEYADETINRCARKIGEGEEIRDVATYCIGIARMVLREMSRDRSRQVRPLDEAPEPRAATVEPESDPEGRTECLRGCLGQLSPDTRNLILHYYQGDQGDKIKIAKASRNSWVPASTLRMRALRVREQLRCVRRLLQRSAECDVTNIEAATVYMVVANRRCEQNALTSCCWPGTC